MTVLMWYFYCLLILCTTIRADFENEITIRIEKPTKTIVVDRGVSVNGHFEAIKIEIEDQPVPTLPSGLFHKLLHLRQIKIQNCGLETLEAGAFGHLPALKIINLSLNTLSYIPPEVFNNLTIVKLYLAGNGIKIIDANAFTNLTSLEDLNLSRNRLNELEEFLFDGLNNLRKLDLSHNLLKSLPSDLLGCLQPDSGTVLNFADNQLDYVNSHVFQCIKRADTIDLSNNLIKQIAPGAFARFESLWCLKLDNNQLVALHFDVLTSLQYVENIELDGNDWICAFINKYRSWSLKHGKINTINLTC